MTTDYEPDDSSVAMEYNQPTAFQMAASELVLYMGIFNTHVAIGAGLALGFKAVNKVLGDE